MAKSVSEQTLAFKKRRTNSREFAEEDQASPNAAFLDIGPAEKIRRGQSNFANWTKKLCIQAFLLMGNTVSW